MKQTRFKDLEQMPRALTELHIENSLVNATPFKADDSVG